MKDGFLREHCWIYKQFKYLYNKLQVILCTNSTCMSISFHNVVKQHLSPDEPELLAVTILTMSNCISFATSLYLKIIMQIKDMHHEQLHSNYITSSKS